MEATEIKHFIEAALLAAGRPLNIDQLRGLFDGRMAPEKAEIRKAIATLNEEYEERGIVVSEVASGFRLQIKSAMADRLQKLWEERPPRYSRALFETLALIAYRQPITRGDIEEIRGVSVSSNIVRQLLERDILHEADLIAPCVLAVLGIFFQPHVVPLLHETPQQITHIPNMVWEMRAVVVLGQESLFTVKLAM